MVQSLPRLQQSSQQASLEEVKLPQEEKDRERENDKESVVCVGPRRGHPILGTKPEPARSISPAQISLPLRLLACSEWIHNPFFCAISCYLSLSVRTSPIYFFVLVSLRTAL